MSIDTLAARLADGDRAGAAALLADYGWLHGALDVGKPAQAVDRLLPALAGADHDDPVATAVVRFLRTRAPTLRRGGADALCALAVDLADDHPVTVAAERWLTAHPTATLRRDRPPHAAPEPCRHVLAGHGGVLGFVLDTAISADGRYAASAGNDATTRLWDLRSGECTAVLPAATLVVIHGGHVVLAGDGLAVHALPAGERVGVLPESRRRWTELRVHPGGRLVAAGYNGELGVWDLDGLGCVGVVEAHAPNAAGFGAGVGGLHALGDRIVTRGGDGLVRSFRVDRGRLVSDRVLHAAEPGTAGLVTLAAGDTLLVGELRWEGAEQVWSWRAIHADGDEVAGWHGPPGTAWLELGDEVVVLGRAVVRFDLRTRASTPLFLGEVPTRAAFASEARRVLLQTDRTAQVVDLDRGVVGVLRGHARPLYCLAITDDGRTAVTGSWDNTVRVWDVEAASGVAAQVTGHADAVTGLARRADALVSTAGDRTVRVWRDERELLSVPTGDEQGPFVLALHPDDRRVLVAGVGFLDAFDLERGERLGGFAGQPHDGAVLVALAAGGDLVAGVYSDGGAFVGDLATFDERERFDAKAASAVAIAADGRVAFGGTRGTTELFGPDGKRVGQCRRHDKRVTALAFHPDGRRLVTTSADRTIRVWDTSAKGVDKGLLVAIEGKTGSVDYLVLHPDGERLITGHATGRVLVHDLDGERIHTLSGHTSGVLGLSLSPDGRRLVSWADDGSVRWWDLDRGRCVATWWSADGVTAAVALADAVVVGEATGRLSWLRARGA